MIQNIIFDWAGTLVDDIDLTLEATNHALVHLGGEPVDLAAYRRDFRIPVMDFYGPRLPGVSEERVDEAFFSYYREHAERLRLFDGVREVLHLTRARGWRVFILSTVPNEVLEPLVTALGLDGFFDGIHGGASDKRRVLPQLLIEEGMDADRTLFCGDTAHDIEAGRLAGVRTAAALHGYGLEDHLLAEHPDDTIGSIPELMAPLDREHLLRTVPLVIPTVGGVVQRADGKILMVRTRKWSGSWGIPGGKIDRGEPMIEAYEREIREETGLELTDTTFVMIQDCIDSTEFVEPRHFLLINYFSRAVEPAEVRMNYEIDDHGWKTLEEARDLPLNEPTRIVLDEIVRAGHLVEAGEAS